MKLNYSVTEQDCLHLSSYFLMRSPRGGFGVWMTRIIGTPLAGGAMFALLTLIEVFFSNQQYFAIWAKWFISIAAALFWLATAPEQWRKLVSGKARKMMTENDFEDFIGRHRLEFTESGLTEYFNGRALRANWSEVVKIVSDEPLVYISLASAEAIIIPLRSYRNDMRFLTREYDKIIAKLKAATGLTVIYSVNEVGLSP